MLIQTALALVSQGQNLSHAVDVAGDDVAAEAPVRCHGPLQVDPAAGPKLAKAGPPQRLPASHRP